MQQIDWQGWAVIVSHSGPGLAYLRARGCSPIPRLHLRAVLNERPKCHSSSGELLVYLLGYICQKLVRRARIFRLRAPKALPEQVPELHSVHGGLLPAVPSGLGGAVDARSGVKLRLPPSTWRPLCGTSLFITCSLIGASNMPPQNELHRSLQVAGWATWTCWGQERWGPNSMT